MPPLERGPGSPGSGEQSPDRPDPSILDRLKEEPDSGRFIPFDRFLEVALYDPKYGYYATARGPRGRSGDFYTAAHVSPLFGAVIGRRVLKEFDRLGRPAKFQVVELGPGDGTLAYDVLSSIASEPRLTSSEVRYVLVESAPSLRALAEERLRALSLPDRIRWGFRAGAADEAPFAGVIVANEFFDALPIRRLVRRGDAWVEQGVRVESRGLEWAENGPAAGVPPPPLPRSSPEGTVIEIPSIAEASIREAGDALARGSILLFDYGDLEESLRGRFPRGSLVGVREHRRVDDPLEDPGSVDLSSFVNFSRLRSAAARAGFRELAYGPQAEALGRWGLPDLLDAKERETSSSESQVRARLAAKNLLFGFENFRVLELANGPAD